MNLDAFINDCRNKYQPEESALIEKALDYAVRMHDGQIRDSGEPYVTHPIAVAQILLDIDMDAHCIAAALLHDVVEDCSVSLDEITDNFGSVVGGLVDGVTKLSKTSVALAREDRQAESTRKMFLAMARDLRVIVIKFADRLHNTRTLDGCTPEKQKRIAQETLAFYAPFAHRLGMGAIKCELEDLAFKYLHPNDYKKLKTAIEPEQMARMHLLEDAAQKITDCLAARGIECRINGRPKHLYSIYRKMTEQNLPLENIYDLTALRVIVNTKDECYLALGEVHGLWNTMPGRDKDYISRPKPNGYQSLHTTLFNEDGLIFEVQIRTHQMHRAAEYGIAAHWMYKEKRSDRTELDEKLAWFREALEYQDFSTTAKEFIDSVQQDFFSDYVFVLTPRGEVIDLPLDSTPLDFAYRIHSNVGNSVQHAKVNGSYVSLDYRLKTHDVVEIITSKAAQPNRDWMKMVKTRRAKAQLIQWFKRLDRDENIQKGHDSLIAALKQYDMYLSDFSDDEFSDLLKKYGKASMSDMYVAIGGGSITAEQIANRLTEPYRREAKLEEQINKKLTASKAIPAPQTTASDKGVMVKGHNAMALKLARCCTPLPGDPIFGYITRGRGISVHRESCHNAKTLKTDPERIIEVEWLPESSGSFMAYVNINGLERKGFLADISKTLLAQNIDLRYITANNVSDGRHVSFRLAFEVMSSEHLRTVIQVLMDIESVESVHRING